MTLPVIHVEIDFSTGPSFGYPFILDSSAYGVLDTNVLADGPSDLVDITAQVRKVSTRRGRNRILSQFEAGTATVTLNDPDSWFNPQNTSSPYYGKLFPLRKIRIYATTSVSGTEYNINIFSGYINSFDTGFYVGTNADATVVLQCVDGFRLLNNVSTGTAPVPGCTAGQLSGTRVDRLLDFAGFPTSMIAVDPGDSTMQADPGGARSILAAIQTVEQSEFGAFFMTTSGKARFLDRTDVSELADVTAREYSDTPTAGQYTYSNLDFAYDDQLVLNDITVTRVDGTPRNAVSAESIIKYFTKSGQRSDILVQTDQESQDQANTLLAARKDADLRIDAMTLNLAADIDDVNTFINLTSDIYTLVNITKSMPGGSSVTRELFIQGVQHEVTPTTWNMKVLTAEPIIQAFILDSTNQGILALTDPPNTNALSY
jgi:hypothetical protein